MTPASNAARIMAKAGRSFALPPGLQNSNFAYNLTDLSPKNRRNGTNGVLPTAAKTPSSIAWGGSEMAMSAALKGIRTERNGCLCAGRCDANDVPELKCFVPWYRPMPSALPVNG